MPSTSRYNGAISNEINPLEVVAGRDASKLRRNKKQQKAGRENKQLKLSGNVDLGSMGFKKQQRRKNGTRKATKTTITTTQHPNTISEDFPPNHHRHNHYDNRQQPKIYRLPTPTTSSQPQTTNLPETSTATEIFTQSTSRATTERTIESTTLSEFALKLLEKVRKSFETAKKM